MAIADVLMRCNDLRCRQDLSDKAVVTTCSHMFCLPCAEAHGLLRVSQEQRLCPACSTTLQNDDDCVATALNPPEDYKTSILSGLSPTIIMECATRALAFYSYQANNAVMYQEHLAQSLSAKYSSKYGQLQEELFFAQNEIMKLRDVIESNRKQIAALDNKQIELTEAFKEKSRALADTQARYNQLKAQSMAAEVQYAASDHAENTLFPAAGPVGNERSSHGFRRPVLKTRQFPHPQPSRLPTATNEEYRGVGTQKRGSASHSQVPGVGDMPFANPAHRQRTRLPVPTSRSQDSDHYSANIPGPQQRRTSQHAWMPSRQ